jgi:hypothetical protein
LLARAGGAYQRPIHVNQGAVEEGAWLLGPNLEARVIEDIEQRVDVLAGEAPTEIASGRGVGNTPGTKGVEKVLIVTAEFDVLQAGAIAQGVVSEVEDVVRFMVRQMDLQEVEFGINRLDEAELSSQGVKGANAAVANTADACRSLVMNVAGGKEGLATTAEVRFVEAALDASLAVVKPPP